MTALTHILVTRAAVQQHRRLPSGGAVPARGGPANLASRPKKRTMFYV